jgi:hypothetical protein
MGSIGKSNTCRLEPHAARTSRVRVGAVGNVENAKSDAQKLSGLVLVRCGSRVSLGSISGWFMDARGRFHRLLGLI